MAFHKKFGLLLDLGADLTVVQECSRKSIEQIGAVEAFSALWVGRNPNKGMGIICKTPWRISTSRDFGLTWAANIKVTGPSDIDLYAIWACKGDRYENRYIRQVHLLLDQIEKVGMGENIALMGDFNSSALWDLDYRGRGHSAAVKRLSELGLQSAYHSHYNEEQGKETRPTLCFRKQRDQVYHIDYVFLSQSLLQAMQLVSVGSFDNWIVHSDHVPLIVDFLISTHL